jgi:immune inhibitor A
MLLASTWSAVLAVPPQDPGDGNGSPEWAGRQHDHPHPLGDELRERREKALEAKLNGKAKGKVHEVAKGQYVELEREGEDSIWTVLGEFNDFSHNSIAEPDRAVDNTTYWVEDFSREHYMEMLFSEEPGAVSMRNFYIEQSSNRYTVNGDVTDWVQVPGDAVDYGEADFDSLAWDFVQDSVNAWYQSQLDAGKSAAEIDAYLSQFDVWDRYDFDGDGNFDEPDGYIDHFQSVHSGEGEEAGGGVHGEDAIWSHRWYVQITPIGAGGPTLDDGTVVPFGGTQVGGSKYWIGDYTIEPENGGVGVFAHEFAHDLGLPDLYDTSGGENGTGFWTLMSSGSWMSSDPENIGTKPNHMGAWEKFQLGWLNYEVASVGQKSSHKLGPAETNTKQAQGLFIVLPEKEVLTDIAEPYAGEHFYYSGAGNNLDNVMYREFDLAAGSSLSARVNYEIELDWDYAYVVVSTDGGASWQSVETNRSTNTNPNGQNFGYGITGDSNGWVELTADLSGYTGTVLVGFRYWTDVAVVEPGFMVDEITVGGEGPFGAETDDGWTLDGFRVTTGSETSFHFNAYVAEFRQYRGYDETLRTGPYNFGFLDDPDLGNWVEHFPYQDGLLISYWDSSQSNNNVRQHPGEGLILPIDAHPEPLIRADGGVWRNRIQSYDSTFGLERTDAITLHWNSQPSHHPSLPAAKVFNDNNLYWDDDNPWGSVKNPQTGTTVSIRSVNAQGGFMQVQVAPAK